MNRIRKLLVLSVLVAAAALAAPFSKAQAGEQKSRYGLWVLDYEWVSEFQGKSITKGGVRSPRALIADRQLNAPVGIAWDGSGDLWLSFQYISMGEILKLTPKQVSALASGRNVKPAVLLQNVRENYPFNSPSEIGFDSEGDLWVMDGAVSSLLEFTPDEIAVSGAPAPAVVIQAGVLTTPDRIRFDASNNLWVDWPGVDQNTGVDEICRFSPADRTLSGPPNPSLILDMPSDVSIADLAFDLAGNLWVTAGTLEAPDVLMEIPADQIAGTGEITVSPAITLTLLDFAQSSCFSYDSLDFDSAGALWVSGTPSVSGCANFQKLAKYLPGQLTSSASISATVLVRPDRRGTNLDRPHLIRVGPTVR
jgi:hypothetical protein